MRRYRGDTGRVRLALELFGINPYLIIFNDNRDGGRTCTASTNYAQPPKGVGRRIKIWHCPSLLDMANDLGKFNMMLQLAFADRLISTKVVPGNSFVIYLKD
jgi:hypothetical protein